MSSVQGSGGKSGEPGRLVVAPSLHHPAGLVDDTALLELLPHAAFIVAVDGDDHFRFVFANGAYRELLDSSGEDVESEGELRSVLPAHALVAHVRAFSRCARELRVISIESDWGAVDLRRTLAVSVTPIVDTDGVCRRLLGAAHEVTDRRVLEHELAHRTRHDPLTDLPNRVMLVEWLSTAIAATDEARAVGLVLLDIDHFKIVNDSLGHEAGDELLSVAARRVDRVLRAG